MGNQNVKAETPKPVVVPKPVTLQEQNDAIEKLENSRYGPRDCIPEPDCCLPEGTTYADWCEECQDYHAC